MALQLSRVVEKVNTGRAFPGNGKYIRYRNYSLGGELHRFSAKRVLKM